MTTFCRSWRSQIAVTSLVTLVACSSCLGATGSTEIFTTGTYAAQEAAPDYMTTTDPLGRTLKVTYGIAAPLCPSDEGKVVIDWNLTSGPTAVFVLRTTGWGCEYTVYGVWDETGSGEPATWFSGFDAENSARIVLEVNEDGQDDDWMPLGGGGTLKVYVMGGLSTDYTVRLQAGSGICFNGEGGPSTIDVTVAGNGNEYQYTPVVLYGQAEGNANIHASCPYTPVAAPADATVAVVAAWEYQASPAWTVLFRPELGTNGLLVSPGEKMSFDCEGSDLDGRRPIGTTGSWQSVEGKGPYEITMTCSDDAEWEAVGSNKKTLIKHSLNERNMFLFIKNTWTGTPDITVTAVVKDNAPAIVSPHTGSRNDNPEVRITWTIKRRGVPPTSLQLFAGPQPTVWAPTPAVYIYLGNPLLNPPGRPCYEDQTVLEEFSDATALGFGMDDLTDGTIDPKKNWRGEHPGLTTPNLVAAFLFCNFRSTTFRFNNQDCFADLILGFGEGDKSTVPFKPSALARGVGYTVPQTYRCGGAAIGQSNIDTFFRASRGLTTRKSLP